MLVFNCCTEYYLAWIQQVNSEVHPFIFLSLAIFSNTLKTVTIMVHIIRVITLPTFQDIKKLFPLSGSHGNPPMAAHEKPLQSAAHE